MAVLVPPHEIDETTDIIFCKSFVGLTIMVWLKLDNPIPVEDYPPGEKVFVKLSQFYSCYRSFL